MDSYVMHCWLYLPETCRETCKDSKQACVKHSLFLWKLHKYSASDSSESSRLQIQLGHAFKVIDVIHALKANLNYLIWFRECYFTHFLKLDVHVHPPITRMRKKQRIVCASIAFDFDLGELPHRIHLELKWFANQSRLHQMTLRINQLDQRSKDVCVYMYTYTIRWGRSSRCVRLLGSFWISCNISNWL